MSNSPVNDPHKITGEDNEIVGPLEHLYEELLQYDGPPQSNTTGLMLDNNGFSSMKISSPKSKTRKRNSKINDQNDAVEEAGAKKLDHNAKERIRRMKLNASYLALRALLPPADSRRSKKKCSAPAIVDRVLRYIPELENEVEVLRSQKENMQSEAENKKKIKGNGDPSSISVNRVNEEEAIIQICMGREDELGFMKLLQRMEDDGICITTASALHICETRICYNLHIQMKGTSEAEYYSIEELREKVTSWLR